MQLDNQTHLLNSFATHLHDMIPQWIQSVFVWRHELTIYVAPEHWLQTAFFLRDHKNAQFRVITDLCAVDYPQRDDRFEVVAHFQSLQYNTRIRLKTCLNDEESLSSLTSIFQGANWYEREVWDLMGIPFSNHPDLRRILTDYGFEGHPLRKDFPLTGYVEVRYDDTMKRVLCEPLELAQEFRQFDFSSPWEQRDTRVAQYPAKAIPTKG